MTDFARELQLYEDIVRGDFDHIDEVRSLEIHDPPGRVGFDFDSAIESYASFRKEGDSDKSRYGRQPTVGLTVDQAMVALERDNPALKDVLPRDYARPAIDKRRLGQLIALISNIQVGDAEARSRDVLGRVYDPCCGLVGDVCAVDGVHPRPRQLKVLLACELADFHRPSPYRTSINSTPKL